MKAKFDVEKVRADFPILQQQVHGKPLVYFDNAATLQKPKQVIDVLQKFYLQDNANVHRGVHSLSERASHDYEQARVTVQKYIHAQYLEEIIFTRGTTDAINLVANSYGLTHLKADDEIIISTLEHHANIVPWQMLCERTGAKLKIIPIDDRGDIIFEEYEKLLSARTKFVAISHISNAIGTVNPVQSIIEKAHQVNAKVLVDAAQSVAHAKIDVQKLNCDFLVFSGHKLGAPTGVGVLYGKADLLRAMPPYQGGGDMIRTVSFEKSTYADIPHKFEAGTPHIAGVIGLAAAIDYQQKLGMDAIHAYEQELLAYATQAMQALPDVKFIGTAQQKAPIISFLFGDVHPHDIGTILDHHGVAIRAGHHCAMPLMHRLQVPATARASMAFYNTFAEVDQFILALQHIQEVFQS